MAGWVVRQRDETEPVRCPCGWAQRVLTAADHEDASVHFVQITSDSETHFHEHLTEIYVVISGDGELELNGERVALRAGSVAMIPPRVRHRAVPGPEGLTIVNFVRPPFDPEDEHVD